MKWFLLTNTSVNGHRTVQLSFYTAKLPYGKTLQCTIFYYYFQRLKTRSYGWFVQCFTVFIATDLQFVTSEDGGEGILGEKELLQVQLGATRLTNSKRREINGKILSRTSVRVFTRVQHTKKRRKRKNKKYGELKENLPRFVFEGSFLGWKVF